MKPILLKSFLSISLSFVAISASWAQATGSSYSSNSIVVDLGQNTLLSTTTFEYGGVNTNVGPGGQSYSTNGEFTNKGAFVEASANANAGAPGGSHSLFFGNQYEFTVRNDTLTDQFVTIGLDLYRYTSLTATGPGDYASTFLYGGMRRDGDYDFRTEFFDTSGGNVSYSNSISYRNTYTIAAGSQVGFAAWASTDVLTQSNAEAVPEPATVALSVGALALARKRRARKS